MAISSQSRGKNNVANLRTLETPEKGSGKGKGPGRQAVDYSPSRDVKRSA